MAQQIGAKIGVDGEAEFKRSLGQVAAEAKALKAEMTALKTEVAGEADEQDRARRIAEKLNEQIANQEERVRLLTEKLEASKAATGETSTETSRYREQLANAQTVLNQMRTEQQGMTSDVNDFKSAEESAGTQAITTGQLIEANLLSEAILGGLKTLARLARGAARAIAGTVTESAEWADEILTLSSQTGIATDELQAYSYAAELMDVSLDTITGSQTKLLQTMSKARDGTEAATEAFAALGVSVTDEDGGLRSVDAVFRDVIDALGQIDNAADRDAAAMAIFGKSARDLNPLIEAGGDALAAYAEEARAMGYILDEDTLGTLGSMDDSLVRLQNLGTTIRNQLGAGMAPGIERVIDKLIELGSSMDWEQIGQSLGSLIESLADLLVKLLDSGIIDRAIGFLDDYMTKQQLLHGWESSGTSTGTSPEEQASAIADAVAEYQAIMARINDPNTYRRISEFTGEEFLDQMAMEADQARMSELLNDPAVKAALGADARALGEDIIAEVGAGIESGVPEARSGLFGLFARPSTTWAGLSYDATTGVGGATGGAVSYGGVSVQIYGAEGQSVSDLYDEFSYRLNHEVEAREAVFG